MRPTVRLRLTLLYGGLFLLAGAILVALNYALARHGIERHQPAPVRFQLAPPPGGPPGSIGAGGAVIPAPGPGLEGPDGFPPGPEPVDRSGRPLSDVIRRYEQGLRQATLDNLLSRSLQALGLMAVGSVALGWVVAGRVLRPLHDITATARRLSEQNLHERISLQGPDDELKELADTFDAMLTRLSAAFESQRRFVANASHELRTPLSIMRTEIDVALADPKVSREELRAMAEAVRDATERSERLLDSLLALARSERAADRETEVDLAAAAARALDQARSEAEARGVSVSSSLRSAVIVGDRPLLERLVANLVENGIRHNTPGGWLEVATSASGRSVEVWVANTGPVVPAEEVDNLFEPFRRLGAARTGSARGSGLGLSVVRSVAVAHGGTVRAHARPEGGLEVRVRLPRTEGDGSGPAGVR